MDVADFKAAVYAAFDPNDKETAAGEDFDKFLAIVREYIEPNARSEVRLAKIKNWAPNRGDKVAPIVTLTTVENATCSKTMFPAWIQIDTPTVCRAFPSQQANTRLPPTELCSDMQVS